MPLCLDKRTAASAVTPDEATIPVHLHPLVLLSVSDHVTRMRYLLHHETCRAGPERASSSSGGGSGEGADGGAREAAEGAPVMGVLLGQTEAASGATGVVMAFEVVFLSVDGDELRIPRPPSPRHRPIAPEDEEGKGRSPPSSSSPCDADGETELQRQRRWYVAHIDWAAVRQKRERLREVFPECQVVGWYTVGSVLGDLACCTAVHESVCRLFGSPTTTSGGGEPDKDAADKDNDNGGGGGGGNASRMLALLLDPRPEHAAAAVTLPTYLYEMQMRHLHHQRKDRRGGDDGAEEEGRLTGDEWRRPCRQSLTVLLNKAGATAATGAASVSFTPIRFHLESEEMEHVAVDAALNMDLPTAPPRANVVTGGAAPRAGREGVGSFPSASPPFRSHGPFISSIDAGLVAQAVQRGAQLKPTVARARRSLWLLRRRVGLATAYVAQLQLQREPRGAATPCTWSTDVHPTDAEALRALSLVASQLPCAPPALPRGRPCGASPSTTGCQAPTVMDTELQATLTPALLALSSQLAIGARALQAAQASALESAVGEAGVGAGGAATSTTGSAHPLRGGRRGGSEPREKPRWMREVL